MEYIIPAVFSNVVAIIEAMYDEWSTAKNLATHVSYMVAV